MPEKRNEPAFTVSDRRKFTDDGELRKDLNDERVEQPEKPKFEVPPAAKAAVAESTAPSPSSGALVEELPMESEEGLDAAAPPPPTADEQKIQADAYKKSSDDLNSRVEQSGRSAKDFEMTFERFMASIYMTAMVQLGLMHQQGEQPRVDIMGARQTIDTLSLLSEKTKGNLTPTEENFLQNSLYEVRMAYVEVTNALARPPQPGVATGTGGR